MRAFLIGQLVTSSYQKEFSDDRISNTLSILLEVSQTDVLIASPEFLIFIKFSWFRVKMLIF